MNNQNTVSNPDINETALWYLLHTNKLTEEQKKLAEAHTKGFDQGYDQGTQSENDRSFMQQEELIKKHKEQLDMLSRSHANEIEKLKETYIGKTKDLEKQWYERHDNAHNETVKAENKLFQISSVLADIRSDLDALKRKRKTPGYAEMYGRIECIAKEISEILNG